MADDRDDGVRLDIWLDVACLFRTRSEAQKASKGGKIDVNGQPAKPNRHVRVGDEIETVSYTHLTLPTNREV